MDIKELLAEATKARGRSKAYEAKAQAAEGSRAEAMSELRRRLSDGESTGNRILDFSLLIYGETDKFDLLTQLDRDIASHPGELVVASRVDYERHVFRDGADQEPRPSDYSRVQQVWLGILSSEVLSLDNKRLTVPVERAVTAKFGSGRGIRKCDSIKFGFPEIYELGEPTRNRSGNRGAEDVPDYGLWIVAGTEAVDRWFADQAEVDRRRYYTLERSLEHWTDIKTKLLESLEPVFVEQELEI